jgi:hypothetical protein
MYRLSPLLALLILAPTAGLADEKPGDHHGGAFMECAKVCDDCQRECDSCARHCALLVAEGKKDHMKTLGTCSDCADMCSTAARVAARQGPMAVIQCEACAKSCDICGEACGSFADDAHMKRCAEMCRTCAKACREMIKHAGHQSKD